MQSYFYTIVVSAVILLAGLGLFPRISGSADPSDNIEAFHSSQLTGTLLKHGIEFSPQEFSRMITETLDLPKPGLVSEKSLVEEGGTKIMVLSDIHIMAPSLIKEVGSALDRYIEQDRKLLREGPEILKAAVRYIIDGSPEVVLIPGDLTKDGELLSHRFVADSLLKPLSDRGIRVFVVPGNHDILNPHAACFMADSTIRVASVSPDDFARIYGPYGYGKALARDTSSLTYLSALNDSVWVLGIDACRYEENDFEKNISVVGGRIKPQTLRFIEEQAQLARRKEIRLLAIMHHGLLCHWKYQDRAMSEYMVEDWKKVARLFSRNGIHLVFTGHFHAQDITSYGRGDRKIFDVETGSTVSYPLPVREMYLYPDRLVVSSCHLADRVVHDSLKIKAIEYAYKAISHMVPHFVPQEIPDSLVKEVATLVGEGYVAHIHGDEMMPDDFEERLSEVVRKVKAYSPRLSRLLRYLAKSIYTDNGVSDNSAVLQLPPLR